ncbi:YdcF family protein [Thiotrichales bacterium 19S3-7]|nr:YdcF family protein [Thiotrichales bacterium 19S3-7]MCF6802864.1 YdcF family protein [Thiotrichales bacterium 19S3-11]
MELFAVIFNSIAFLLYPVIFCLIILILAYLFKKIRKILIAVIIILLYFFANGVLTQPIITHLQIQNHSITEKQILNHRAMILLGGGLTRFNGVYYPSVLAYSRINQAYQIYRVGMSHGIKYTIFISGGNTAGMDDSEANVYRAELVKLGVPAEQIKLEDNSLNTYENARNMAFIVGEYPFKTYLLVTSGFHMKRAIMYFKNFHINVIPAPSDFIKANVGLIPTAYNLAVFEIAMHEYIGIARLSVYDALGLNA